MKILKNVLLILAGFIGGVMFILKFIVKGESMLRGFKMGLIDDFERLLLGYNTIKTTPYPYRQSDYNYHKNYYNNYRRTFSDYYKKKSFEEDEDE